MTEPPPTMRILLATRNAGKVREIREASAGAGVEWHSLEEFPEIEEPEETGATFSENARLKALYYAHRTGLPTLADDSGLEVDSLGGAPGVHSARYAGLPRDDAANNRKLVAALNGLPSAGRAARFRCTMALVRDGRVLVETSGAVEGVVIDEPRGSNGFGYDPHFFLPDRNKTVAELPPEEKNAISHRGQALRKMIAALRRLACGHQG